MNQQKYKWALVALLWVVAVLNYVDRQVIFSVFPLVQKEMDVSNVQLGLLGTAFLWVYGLLSPFGGYVADRFGRRWVILGSLVVWSAVTYLTGHARGYNELLTARALMGISEAFYLPAALALIADFHDGRTRSVATGLHQSGLYTGIVLGGAGGGWMGAQYGWRTAFLLLGGVGLAYALVLMVGLRDRPAARSESGASGWANVAALVRPGPLLAIVGVNCTISIGYWCVYTWLPLYLFERFHMTLAGAGFSATFYIQVASFCGILAGGVLADRWSRANPRGRVFTQAIGLAAAGPFLFLVGSTASQWALLPGLILFGLGRGFYDCNLMPVVCQVVPENSRATAYGILNMTSCLTGGVIAAGGGYLKDTIGLGGALQISAVLLTLAAVPLARLRLKSEA
jgi:MFS transporter, Spinster family, sphingosine-1-phosphate transporter